jgi:hypothetical protein
MQASEEENIVNAAIGQDDFGVLMRAKMRAAVRLMLMVVLSLECTPIFGVLAKGESAEKEGTRCQAPNVGSSRLNFDRRWCLKCSAGS